MQNAKTCCITLFSHLNHPAIISWLRSVFPRAVRLYSESKMKPTFSIADDVYLGFRRFTLELPTNWKIKSTNFTRQPYELVPPIRTDDVAEVGNLGCVNRENWWNNSL